MERRRCQARRGKTGAHRQGRRAHRERAEHPGREVRDGLQRDVWRDAAPATAAVDVGQESGSGEFVAEHQKLGSAALERTGRPGKHSE